MTDDARSDERALIGSVLVTPELLPVASEHVTPPDFGHAENAAIWEALLALEEDGAPIGAVALKGRLAEHGTLEASGGAQAIAALMVGVPAASETSVRYWAKRVAQAGRHRKLSGAVSSLASQSESLTPDEIEAALDALLAGTAQGSGVCDRAEVARNAWAMLEAEVKGDLKGMTTGIPDLDRKVRYGGWRPGQVIYVGARTSRGKSALCLGIAEAAAAAGEKVLFFPLEMAPEDLEVRRYVSSAGTDFAHLHSWRQSEREEALELLRQARARIAGRQLYFARTATRSLSQIRATCRRHKQRPGLGLVVVDYLGLVEHERAKQSSLYERTTMVSQGLKAVAMELQIPVVCAVQLNRDASKGQGGKPRRPSLADFRDSGAIEQDCDIAILIHQEGPASAIQDGEAVLIMDKQRNGWTGDVKVRWRAACARFEAVADVQEWEREAR